MISDILLIWLVPLGMMFNNYTATIAVIIITVIAQYHIQKDALYDFAYLTIQDWEKRKALDNGDNKD